LAGALFGPSASAVTTSKNVDAGVTRGAALTTFTFVNNTGGTLPAGIPISMGQAFRYGDVMPGIYPVIRDAATHVALRGQQWDEISTWRENGGNGSWRHAVWAIWLPKNLVGGASYTVEFVLARGVYSQSSHQPLGALCKGSGAHDLKIHLGDVRNQDDTVRDGGEASFRLCDNIANVGRDDRAICGPATSTTSMRFAAYLRMGRAATKIRCFTQVALSTYSPGLRTASRRVTCVGSATFTIRG